MRKPYTKIKTESTVPSPALDKWAAAYLASREPMHAGVGKGVFKMKQGLQDINGALSVVEDAMIHLNKFISPAAKDAFLKDLNALVATRLRSMK